MKNNEAYAVVEKVGNDWFLKMACNQNLEHAEKVLEEVRKNNPNGEFKLKVVEAWWLDGGLD